MVKPFSYAPITLIEGEQRSGKTNTAVARVVDPTFANITSVILPNRVVVKAEPITPTKVGWAKLWLPNREPIVTKLPSQSCAIADGMRVFANFHIYGIKNLYLPLSLIIEYLNSGLIQDAYLIIDEGYIGGDAREGMSALVRVLSKLGFQIGKRHLHLLLCIPHARIFDWRFRWIETEKIICDYDERTQMITLEIRNRRRSRKTRTYSYHAPQYWSYYDTDEQFEIPEGQIAKALASAR